MPASMMMPPAGSILKVSGSNSAMVAAGPSPGMMPTMVPSRHPTKHHRTLLGCSATANPCSSPPAISISEPERTGGKWNAERDREYQVERQRGHNCGDAGGQQGPAKDDRDDEEGQQRKAGEESEPAHEDDREREREPRGQRPARRRPVDRVTLGGALANGVHDQHQRERHHSDAVPEREEARPRPIQIGILPGE